MRRRLLGAAAFLVAVAAFSPCSSPKASPVPLVEGYPFLRSLDGSGAGKIRHVVYVVQENRSFNNMFEGYPGADTTRSGRDSSGGKVPLKPISLKTIYEIDHSAFGMFFACNGTGGASRHEVPDEWFQQRENLRKPER
jgi:phospholipase C